MQSAFLPFGETVVQIPLDYATGKHRGFAFVEFESAEDALDAIDNMVKMLSLLTINDAKLILLFILKHESEIYGRTIRVNLAKPGQKQGDKPGNYYSIKLFLKALS